MNIPEIKALIFMKYHSERVPFKNVRPLAGKPLFHWIMEELGKSKYIKEIIINTDSEIIAEEAQKNFPVTIHMRPEYLLKITSNEANQILEYDINNTEGEYFLQTHSTNPLLKASTIDKSIETFFASEGYDSLFSVTPLQKRFFYQDGKPLNHDPEKLIKTQELPYIYEENSCIYIFSRNVFNQYKNRIGKKSLLFPMDKIEAQDIDEEYEFMLAEYLMKMRLESEK